MVGTMKSQWGALLGVSLVLGVHCFAFIGCSGQSARSANIGHFSKSIDYANQATALKNRGGPGVQPVTNDDIGKMVAYYRSALSEAKAVDIEQLNRDYPGFGDHYRDEFRNGVQRFIDAYENSSNSDLIEAQVLLDKWGTWYGKNIDAIRAIK